MMSSILAPLSLILSLLLTLFLTSTHAATFVVVNQCTYTIWAAASPGVGLFNYLDFLDISLVNGFNLPMLSRPTSGSCRGIRCLDEINGQCPEELKAPGGCNNPCIYCCNNKSESYGLTTYSQFFKDKCPDAYTYPLDVPATFTCPSGTNCEVTFCHGGQNLT
ncbi:hypothetical protein EUGRSUZ_D01897 [Eucalyptus grandis]|uniref:Osmotin-like protein n=2 Tax=Eucalyptus grandis TaxID=71139 RepID=A0A059CGK2_EUCGR|nr:hypothetical protein EUGRSUZ_D01897 [Eucalyptus grandis]